MGSWNLVIGDESDNAGALADEIYDDIKEGFQELLALQGVPITFASIEKQCLAPNRMDEKLEWKSAGFLPDVTVTVNLLDSDFEEFSLAGIEEAQATVDFEGLTFQVIGIKKLSAHPIVSLMLNKSK